MKRCYRDPPAAIWESARLLRAAGVQHNLGDPQGAEQLIREADMADIGAWFRAIVGPYDPNIHGSRPHTLSPPVLPKELRKRPRMPTVTTKRVVLGRDGMHCRFCSGPVVPKDTILAMASAYPATARWSNKASDQHQFLQAMSLQFDHIVPHSRGGDSDEENMVVTCAACNYGRISWTLEEAGLLDPRLQSIHKSDWDGLVGAFGGKGQFG